ncbi:MAG: DUF4157 domain-containing protein [Chrysiogenales bacterium]|nr:MAG: DUF4157 domain-containing protein [Chrysiogenales bacterium]
MSVIDFLKEKGGCEGGKLVYFAAKKSAAARNGWLVPWSGKITHRLNSRIINCLQPLYNHADLTQVRFKIDCSLPPNWFTASNSIVAMTFGNMIYFKGHDVQKREEQIKVLMHELVHVDQVVRFGSETNFACEYGKGYLLAGDYEDNHLEMEAYNFTDNHPVPTACLVETAKLEWWHGKNFTGTKHTKYLYSVDHGKKIKLIHNDEMKSLKLYAKPGWILEIYDSGSCSKSDDWGKVIYPSNNVFCVTLPRIGSQGVSTVVPQGCYEFHYKNGLPGKVSAIRHYGP